MRRLTLLLSLLAGVAVADNLPYSNGAPAPTPGLVPTAASGVTPTTCTGSSKGQQYVTAAGALCSCNGTTWQNLTSFNVNASLVTGLGTASATTCVF